MLYDYTLSCEVGQGEGNRVRVEARVWNIHLAIKEARRQYPDARMFTVLKKVPVAGIPRARLTEATHTGR